MFIILLLCLSFQLVFANPVSDGDYSFISIQNQNDSRGYRIEHDCPGINYRDRDITPPVSQPDLGDENETEEEQD